MNGTPAVFPLATREALARREPLSLADDHIDVWAFTLDADPSLESACRHCLSETERAKADRFLAEDLRRRYVIAHGTLRHILGRYCRLDPALLVFEASPAGKPRLQSPGNAPAFNLTHSEDRALLGVSGAELGIDLEKERSDVDMLAIGRNYFFGSEREALERARSDRRAELFFRYWVAKEAVLKAQGVGLGMPLDRFRVDFAPDGLTASVTSFDPARLGSDWTLRMLSCGPGWAGAVAARGRDWNVRLNPRP